MFKVNIILYTFVCLFSLSCFAQVKTIKLDKASIPKSVTYVGTIINAVKYTDTTGETIVITTETGESQSTTEGDGYRDAELFAYQYVLANGVWKLQWKVYDFIKECPVDIEANFVKNTFAITDLDKNGQAEVWLTYTTTCHGDVSPSDMKIIMYQGGKKHAMRGETKVRISEKDYIGGTYTFDETFKQAPSAFREYALKLWKNNVTQK